MPSSNTSLNFLDRDKPWHQGQIGPATWDRLKARLTGGKDSAGRQYSSFVKLSTADADKIIAKMKEDPRGFPQIDEKGKDGGYYNLEAYQNWLVEEYLESNEPPGLDDILKEIREEKQEIKKAPKPKVSKVKSSAIVPSKFIGAERYQAYLDELTSNGTIGGRQLSPTERKEGFKKRGNKIDFEKFVDKVLKKKTGPSISGPARTSPGRAGAIVKSPVGAIQPFVPSPVSEKTQENLDDIMKGIDSILNTIRSEQKFKKDVESKERRRKETESRSRREDKLETGTFKKLAKATEKVLAPVKNLFQKILDFFLTVFAGRVLFKLVDWFSDDANKEKLNAIGRFLKDWWPALLGSYIAFGTSLGRFITFGVVGKILKWTAMLTRFAIPKLLLFAKNHPLLAGAAIAGVGAYAITQMNQGNREEENKENDAETVTPKETKETGQTPGPSQLMRESVLQRGAQLSGGGRVPGSGSGDTVPAMLTPGEFVMSKGAVSQFGSDTLAAMNAMGGGTNRPIYRGGIAYAAGGGMPRTTQENKEGQGRAWWDFLGWAGTGKPNVKASGDAAKSGTGGTLKLSAQDFRDLAYIVSSEAARGTDDEYGVAASILNRVADPKWPNTIAAVGSQRGQYEAVYKGMAKDDPKLAAKLASPEGQSKIVEALKILKGRTDFKGQSQLGNKGKDDPMFSNRGNFFHYTSQVGRNDPAPANPPQHWKKLVGSGGPPVQISTTSGPSGGLASFGSGGSTSASISSATTPPSIPPPTGQDIQALFKSAMMAVDAPMTGQNFAKSPSNTLPDFDAAIMHEPRKIKVLGMST